MFALAMFDVVFPLLPSETAVITAGTLAADGKLFVVFVVATAALGAFAGDNLSYLLGRVVGEPVAERLFRGDKGKERLRWARKLLDRHGALVIVVARFLPGGRTATTFAAGAVEMDWRRFAAFDAIAALAWAVVATMLGFLGGKAFAESPWKGLVMAFGIGILLAGAIEIYRRVQEHRGHDIFGAKERA